MNETTEADRSIRADETMTRRQAFILTAFDPAAEPRVTRLSESLETAGFDVCQIGTYPSHITAEGPSVEQLGDRQSRVRVERTLHDFDVGRVMNATDMEIGQDIAPLLFLDFIRRQEAGQVCSVAGGDVSAEQAERFQSLCSYVFDSNMALLQAARLCGSPDLIVAYGFEALPAGIAAGRALECPVIYDAGQLWASSIPGLAEWEWKFWFSLEKLYAGMAKDRFTVSTQLAREMTRTFGQPFDSVPNIVSLSEGFDKPDKPHARMHRDKVVFLFQGEFAEQSGLEQLIAAWPQTDPSCILYLRGADTPFKTTVIDLAEATGLLNQRIYFPRPVRECDLMGACVLADVGLVLHRPDGYGSLYSYPAGLSHYMAAGRPVIAGKLDFVSEIIAGAKCGQTVDFGDLPQLLQVIGRFAGDKQLRDAYGRNARSYFEQTFHWEKQSGAFLDAVREIAAATPRKGKGLDLGWTGNQSLMRKKAPLARPAVAADIPLIQRRILSEYENQLADYENQLTALRVILEKREKMLAALKKINGLTRYGARFIRNRFVHLFRSS